MSEIFVLDMMRKDGTPCTSSTSTRSDIRQEATRLGAFRVTVTHWLRNAPRPEHHPLHGWRMQERYEL